MNENAIKNLENKRNLYIAGLFSICHSLIIVFIAFLLESLVNTASQGDVFRLKQNFLTIGIYLVVAFIVTKVNSTFVNRYVANQNENLRNFLFSKLLNKQVGDYQKIGVGKALALLENDVMLLEKNYYRAKLSLISLCSTFLFGIIAMFVINWKIAIIVILTSLLPVLFSASYSKPLGILQNTYSESYGSYIAALKNALTNYNLIKTFHIENKVLEDVSEQCVRQEQHKKEYQIRADRTDGYTSLVGMAVIIAVFGVGTVLVMRGEAEIGSLLAFIQLTNYVLSPIEGISICIGHINSCNDILKKMQVIAHEQYTETIGVFPKQFDIRLSDVSYCYGDKCVLKDISLSLEKGKRYVIVGSNGSGKSTLLRIISRFYENYSGEVLYGETEAREIAPISFYEKVVMLQQDVLILKDTVKNNILLYRDGISKDVLLSVLQSLQLEELFSCNEVCLDNGDNLSGGEKQRIAAARAMLRKPQILLIDEGFSAIDPSMREVVENIVLSGADIVVAVSHDHSIENLRKYDEVIYMDAGRIIAKGPVEQVSKALMLKSKM